MAKIRRIALACGAAAIMALAPAAAIAAPGNGNGNGNSHAEYYDGCDHGATGKPCRPDPQPSHGKDCLYHGKWGGVNEDHCASGETS